MAKPKTTAPAKATAPVPSQPGVSFRDYVAQLPAGHTLAAIAKGAKVPASSLSMYLKHQSVAISVKNAKKLQKWSGGKISAALTLGLDP